MAMLAELQPGGSCARLNGTVPTWDGLKWNTDSPVPIHSPNRSVISEHDSPPAGPHPSGVHRTSLFLFGHHSGHVSQWLQQRRGRTRGLLRRRRGSPPAKDLMVVHLEFGGMQIPVATTNDAACVNAGAESAALHFVFFGSALDSQLLTLVRSQLVPDAGAPNPTTPCFCRTRWVQLPESPRASRRSTIGQPDRAPCLSIGVHLRSSVVRL